MKVLVGLSGGVDSSVVAYLLKKAGHEVIGATMSIWNQESIIQNIAGKKACFSPHEKDDVLAAKELCKKLDIPYYVFDCTEQYRKIVLENFKAEYLAGRTPNPCVICNSAIKFSVLPMTANQNGIQFDKFATGHYARVVFNEITQKYQLQAAVDKNKDQSYFLYALSQEQLSNIMMPLGEYYKEQIRLVAKEAQIAVCDKPDSQDFYSGDINDILQATPKPGNFVDCNGKILGKHNGIWNFTVGQRRGLGLTAEKPLYVLSLNAEKNEVVVGFAEELNQKNVIVKDVIWSSGVVPQEPLKCFVKIRSAQQPSVAQIEALSDKKVKVVFEESQKAVAPGQSAVFYDENDTVVGGGIIEK